MNKIEKINGNALINVANNSGAETKKNLKSYVDKIKKIEKEIKRGEWYVKHGVFGISTLNLEEFRQLCSNSVNQGWERQFEKEKITFRKDHYNHFEAYKKEFLLNELMNKIKVEEDSIKLLKTEFENLQKAIGGK